MPARDPETFGERVAILRAARGLDQIQLGEIVTAALVEAGDRDPERPAIGRNRIGAWECGRATPSPVIRRALAVVLGASPHLLLGDYPFEVPPRRQGAAGDDPETFGERLAAIRGARGLGQDELGEDLARQLVDVGAREALAPISKVTISGWENDRHRPSIDTIAALCRVLRCPSDILLGLSPFRVPPLVVAADAVESCRGPAGGGYSLEASSAVA